MPTFDESLKVLRQSINAQGERVLSLTLSAVESYFDGDRTKALAVIAGDEEVDRVDVEIERSSVPLLGLGMNDEFRIRSVLTIVKVNNELERIADHATNICEQVIYLQAGLIVRHRPEGWSAPLPPTP